VEEKKKELWLALINFAVLATAMVLLLKTVESNGIWEEPLLSLALFFVFPVLFIKFFLKKKPRDYFWNIKKARSQTEWALAVALVFIFTIWLIVLKWEGSGSFWQGGTVKLLLFINTFLLPVVVFSQEFFFRGFLLKIFRRNWSAFWAVVIQATLFTGFKLLTNVEINNLWRLIALWIISFLLGVIVLRFRSIVVSTVVYWIYLFLVDLYVVHGSNQFFLKMIVEKNI